MLYSYVEIITGNLMNKEIGLCYPSAPCTRAMPNLSTRLLAFNSVYSDVQAYDARSLNHVSIDSAIEFIEC